MEWFSYEQREGLAIAPKLTAPLSILVRTPNTTKACRIEGKNKTNREMDRSWFSALFLALSSLQSLSQLELNVDDEHFSSRRSHARLILKKTI